ncbi:ATP-binding protein [Algoriphagus yeomjeoni]|uniref:histidine kinase n=1 Tax=Algoriphagus yeomjeoni TaxID=291403 RepID=A0A327PV59_9BACT|nr:ATP-binding protein [Algoriphagus yeomjeoni]RAI94852.1 phospho-acceptor domain-containing protein [Algoriphagus yeomjeoni]
MKITEALKAELANWLDTYWTTYMKGDFDVWSTFIAEDYYNIGGTKEEIWHTKQEILDYSYSIHDQMVGQAEVRNREIEALPYGDYIMVNEFTDLYVKIEGEWTYYGPFRMSSLLAKTATGWIALHQHGSFPDMKTSEGEAFASDALKAENKRLQDAVDQRTSELLVKNRALEIETSLEKVRTAAMGMTAPNDMLHVCRVIAQQLSVIGLDQIRNVQTAIIESQEEIYLCYQYFPRYDQEIVERTEYSKNPVEQQLVTQMLESKNSHFLGELTGKELHDFIKHRKQENHLEDPLLEEVDKLGYCFLSIGEGGLGLTLYKSLDEQSLTIFKRFHQVFSLAYQRFRDIQKAEAQAREAQIEASLEKVRAHAMGLRKSDELQNIIKIIFEELQKIGLTLYECSIFLRKGNTRAFSVWGKGNMNDEGFLTNYQFNFVDHPLLNSVLSDLDLKIPFRHYSMDKEEIKSYGDLLFSQTDFKYSSQEYKDSFYALESVYAGQAFFKHGFLEAVGTEPLPGDLPEVLKRFSQVIDLTYTRFLDLQKAEAQVREAQIETGLERVRSRSLAMHRTEELQEAAEALNTELNLLGIQNINQCGYAIYNEAENSQVLWLTRPDGSSREEFTLPSTGEKILNDRHEAWKKQEPLFHQQATNEQFQHHLELVFDQLGSEVAKGIASKEMPNNPHFYCANFRDGYLHIVAEDALGEEQEQIMVRFARVFSQTYTRFLDLQKAEAQAREGQIQLALERVRARTMAMQHSDELMETSELMFEQIKNLGIKLWSCGFSLWHDDDSYFLGYNPGPHGKLGNPLKIPLTEDIFFKTIREAKRRNDKFLVFESEGESLAQTYNYMDGLPVVGETMRGFVKAGFPLPTFQVNHCGFFANGHLMFITEERNPEAIEIFKRFTEVFHQTYTRFLDLQRAEAQAREAKIEAALERIRSRSLAMHHSSELSTVVDTLLQEFTKLEFTLTFCIINLIDGDDLSNTVWAANPETGKDAESYYMKFEDYDFHRAMWSAWKSQDKRFVYTLEGEEKKIYDEYLYSETEFRRFPKHVQEANKALDRYVAGFTFFKYSGLQTVSENEITEADLEILERFGKVFEQSYTRFLDLQKAEAQAKEAHIESSLERVRAQTMAMHNSEDVGKCIVMMFEELTALGVNEKTRFGIGILNHENENNQLWTASKIENEFKLHIGNLEMSWHPLLKSARKAWKEQLSLHTYILEGEDLINYYQMLNQAPDYKIQIPIDKLPDKEFHYGFVFEHGFFYAFSPLEFSTDLIQIIHRFSSLFSQTYRRYLDLKKAEAQAREAQINLAVERVRARALAMFKSEEILEVVVKLKEEIIGLDIPGVAAAAILLKEKNGKFRSWDLTSLELNGESMHTPLDVPFEMEKTHPDFYLRKVWEKGTNYTVVVQDTKSLQITCDWLRENNKVKEAEEAEEFLKSSGLQRGYHPTVPLNNGRMILDLLDPPEDEIEFILTKMGGAFDLAYKRFEDLEKAEAQTREARIEAALEKIRARTMGMQHSKELPEAANLLFLEIQALGIPSWSAGYNILADDKRSAMCWMSSEGVLQKPFQLRLWGEASFDEMREFVLSDRTMLVQELGGKAIEDHYTHMKSFPDLKPTFDHIEEKGLSLPTYQINHLCKFTQGFVLFITYEKVPEAHDIFKRFTKVFEQTFTRFLDLQKSEAQAKESRIEAALERVRSRTMGMQKAEELGDVATVLFGELNTLVDNLWTCGFVLCEKDRKEDDWWLSLDNGLIQPFSLPNEGDYAHESLYEGWKKGNSYHTVTLEGKHLEKHYDWLMAMPVAEQIFEEMEDSGIPRPKWQRLHAAYFKTGYLVIITEVPCEEEDIFKRFAKVFEQTYTRFLDLKKAEKQAKEAKVETALERIRAQVTGMRESEELLEIVVNMRKEFVNLGHEAHYFWHMRWLPETYDKAMTSGDGTQIGMVMSLPRHIHGDIPAVAAWEKGNEPTHILAMDVDLAVDYVDKMVKLGDFERIDPQAPTLDDIRHIGGLTFVMARTTHGEIGYSLPGKVEQPPRESIETLARFAGVFDLAYRRFEDLLTAEKQNRKAKIELALERVRARAMAMQHPEELIQVANVMREEMGHLGVEELETSSIYINDSDSGLAECWYSILDVREGAKKNIADHFSLDYRDTWVGRQMFDFYQGDQTNISILMKGENRKEWINYCAQQSPKLNGYYGLEIPERTYHLTKFSNGAIGAATPGEISHESWDLLQRAATVFSLAYSRFKDLSQAREDLKKLKQAKAKAEKALKELKSAQEQLVQQEKLASLGQLTAGIAHEIKNPLNFVNNFSDLSRELLEEVFEELENLEASDTKEEVIAILTDVKNNLTKVHEHGTRANGIVSSMLQHSRASGNKREPKSFNPLVKEFTNLSFHGMRAAKEPINVDIDLQLDPNIGEVNLISEDFSRVILNLCNNAFDAMRDKLRTEDGRQKTEDGVYLPKLTVRTALQKDKVILSITDNGSGIPKEIQDKILQPFFTTKKGTEGTGLGLSITHDIVKAHGGELLIQSIPGQTIFQIQLTT